MIDHGAREHAVWSASSTERNWNCPGALALTDGLPDNSSEAADWGTCAHMLAERCLHDNGDADRFIGTTEKGKKHSFEVDEEMADTAQQHVDYVRSRVRQGRTLYIEQRFSLADLDPPFQAGGTADAVIYSPADEHIEVVDLKGGRGHVVEVIANPQLRTYALGAILANKGLAVRQVTVTIVQPRAPHKDGRIRSETFHVADLMEWTLDLIEAMREAKRAIVEKEVPYLVHEATWNSTFLKAGNHCKFCKAAGFCPALEQRATDAAGVWFDDMDQPRISNSPDTLSPEELAKRLDVADMIAEWISAVRAYAHAQAEHGVEIPNYQLVEKIGRRRWKYEPLTVAAQLDQALGATDDELYERSLRSPAQIEKKFGKTAKAIVAELVEIPVTGTNLVASNKTTRPAAAPAAHKHFAILD